MKRRNPNELDRDWHEIANDITAISERVQELQPMAPGNLHATIKKSVLLQLRIAKLKCDLMRAKELQRA